MSYFLVALIGLAGGIASGLFGVGGGVIFVPFLILVKQMDPHVAIGTSIAVIVPTALIAAWKHSMAGVIDWKIVFFLIGFSMLGAWVGAVLSLKWDVLLLRRLFALLMVFVAVKLFFQN